MAFFTKIQGIADTRNCFIEIDEKSTYCNCLGVISTKIWHKIEANAD